MNIIKYISIVFCILLISVSSCTNYPKEQLERDVKASISLQNTDPNIEVLEVQLVRSYDNTYEGFMNSREYGEPMQYNLTVIVDGNEFIWELY